MYLKWDSLFKRLSYNFRNMKKIKHLTSKLDNHNHVVTRFAPPKNTEKMQKNAKKCKNKIKYTAFGLPSWPPTLVLTELKWSRPSLNSNSSTKSQQPGKPC